MLPKITDINVEYVKRGNENLGIIFPGGAGGNFLFTFYARHSMIMLASIDQHELQTRGSCHNRDPFQNDLVDGLDESALLDSNFRKDFIGHFPNQYLVRKKYPRHFLISIAPDPDMYLFIIYMLIQKTFRWREDFQSLSSTEKTLYIANMLWFIKTYQYRDKYCDMLYTTKELFYNKTSNCRLIEYRSHNKKHHAIYIDYFEQMLLAYNGMRCAEITVLQQQLDREKQFLVDNKNQLYI